MLGNSTRKKLNSPNWREVAKHYQNLSEAVGDMKRHSNLAINDLILLANKLPNNEQGEIFSPKNIKRLIKEVLNGNAEGLYSYSKARDKCIFRFQDTQKDIEINTRIIQIAAFLVAEGTRVCLEHYRETRERDMRLNEPIIDILNKSAGICDAIAFPLTRVKSKQQTILLTKNDAKTKKDY